MTKLSVGLACLLLAAGCGGQSSLTPSASPDATLTQVSFSVPGMT
jgi:hypothetical protein